VDRDSILIGEPVRLTIDVWIPMGENITWFALDSIPHFEFLDKGKADTSSDVDGKKMQQVLTITSFDSGRWQIPPLVLVAGNKKFNTDSIGIEVGYSAVNHAEDYHDIKEIEEISKPWWIRFIPWMVALMSLVAITLLVYILRRNKQEVQVVHAVVSKLPPYEEAIQALQELYKKGWAQNGQVKNYYSSLNDILRVFILRKLNIATLEKTNEELIAKLRTLSMEKESFKHLSEALRIADFVKFARYLPDAADNEKNFIIIQTAITTLNNINIT